MDDVNCMGSETRIEDCNHGGWGSHNCGHEEDISISCTPGKKLFFSFLEDNSCKKRMFLVDQLLR